MNPHLLPVEENHFIKMRSPGVGAAGFPVWLRVALLHISEALSLQAVGTACKGHGEDFPNTAQGCVIRRTHVQLCFSGSTG